MPVRSERPQVITNRYNANLPPHKNGLEVVFFPIDFSRAELKWAIDLIEKVGKEGHMDPPSLKLRRGKPAMKYFV